jgi:hypothetical protein
MEGLGRHGAKYAELILYSGTYVQLTFIISIYLIHYYYITINHHYLHIDSSTIIIISTNSDCTTFVCKTTSDQSSGELSIRLGPLPVLVTTSTHSAFPFITFVRLVKSLGLRPISVLAERPAFCRDL